MKEEAAAAASFFAVFGELGIKRGKLGIYGLKLGIKGVKLGIFSMKLGINFLVAAPAVYFQDEIKLNNRMTV
ncbi:hypothetical protein [Planomicrobium okeanokoites]|uniref:hypothetical protein n=1 Tax=Planomicrobium okeanokoites TaxID=244 RepID=UPI0024900D2E|nr:hypothetical protein [Planomicrobium okeanokoites]